MKNYTLVTSCMLVWLALVSHEGSAAEGRELTDEDRELTDEELVAFFKKYSLCQDISAKCPGTTESPETDLLFSAWKIGHYFAWQSADQYLGRRYPGKNQVIDLSQELGLEASQESLVAYYSHMGGLTFELVLPLAAKNEAGHFRWRLEELVSRCINIPDQAVGVLSSFSSRSLDLQFAVYRFEIENPVDVETPLADILRPYLKEDSPLLKNPPSIAFDKDFLRLYRRQLRDRFDDRRG